MAPRIVFAINRATRMCAVFPGGDERGLLSAPKGWEELEPRAILRTEAEFDRWIKLDPEARLLALAPPGFKQLPAWRRLLGI